MNQKTAAEALAILAKVAAEIAASIAAATSESAAHALKPEQAAMPVVTANLIVGAIMPAEQRLEELQAIFRAMHALHTTRTV